MPTDRSAYWQHHALSVRLKLAREAAIAVQQSSTPTPRAKQLALSIELLCDQLILALHSRTRPNANS